MNGKQHVSALTTQLRVEYTHTQMIVCLRSVGFVHAKGTAPAKFQHFNCIVTYKSDKHQIMKISYSLPFSLNESIAMLLRSMLRCAYTYGNGINSSYVTNYTISVDDGRP